MLASSYAFTNSNSHTSLLYNRQMELVLLPQVVVGERLHDRSHHGKGFLHVLHHGFGILFTRKIDWIFDLVDVHRCSTLKYILQCLHAVEQEKKVNNQTHGRSHAAYTFRNCCQSHFCNSPNQSHYSIKDCFHVFHIGISLLMGQTSVGRSHCWIQVLHLAQLVFNVAQSMCVVGHQGIWHPFVQKKMDITIAWRMSFAFHA